MSCGSPKHSESPQSLKKLTQNDIHFTHVCYISNNKCGCPKDFCHDRQLKSDQYFIIHYCSSLQGFIHAAIVGSIISALDLPALYGIISPAIGCLYCWTRIYYYEINGCQKTGCLCYGKKCCTDFSDYNSCLCCDKPCITCL